jgi:copper chaperone CopZ
MFVFRSFIIIWLAGIIPLFPGAGLKAQFISARIGVDGLTCSACTRATELSLLNLAFVEYADMDLNNNTAFVMFRPGQPVDIQQLSQAVYDAGFSVRDLYAVFDFSGAVAVTSSGPCFSYDQKYYASPGSTSLPVSGRKELRFIGKKLCTKKTYKAMSSRFPGQCQPGVRPDYYFMIEN